MTDYREIIRLHSLKFSDVALMLFTQHSFRGT